MHHCQKVKEVLRAQQRNVREKKKGLEATTCAGGAILALDMSQAFDRVDRHQLRKSLEQSNLPQALVELITQWHNGIAYHLRSANKPYQFTLKPNTLVRSFLLVTLLRRQFAIGFNKRKPKGADSSESYRANTPLIFSQRLSSGEHAFGPPFNMAYMQSDELKSIRSCCARHLRAIASCPVHHTRLNDRTLSSLESSGTTRAAPAEI